MLFLIKKFWFQHICALILWYGFKGEIAAIIIFFKTKILKYFFVSVKFSLLYYSWKNLIIISIFISFTIVIMTYDVYNSFKLALMVVECIGKKSSLLLMRLMMIFSISFAENNCIFLKIFAFWNTCKRTACSYLRKNPSLLQGFTRISCFEMAKSCCFKLKLLQCQG